MSKHEFTLADWGRLAAMLAAIGIYGHAWWLSFLARATRSILMWSLCILIASTYSTLYGLYLTGWFDFAKFTQQIRPFLFPTNLIIWILPALDWIWRLKQANEAGRDFHNDYFKDLYGDADAEHSDDV